MKRHRIFVLLMLVFSTIEGLLAQSADTMYVVTRHVVRDTVYVRDTVRVQDTIIIADYIHSEEFKRLFYELNGVNAQTPPDSLEKLWAQTVTFLENRVIQYEQQNVSTMDSIKKYGLAGLLLLGLNSLAPAQTEAPQPVLKRRPSRFCTTVLSTVSISVTHWRQTSCILIILSFS